MGVILSVIKDTQLISQLQQHFIACRPYARLLAKTARDSAAEVNLNGLHDSAKSLLLSVLVQEIKRPLIVVAADAQQAIRFYQELVNLSRVPVFLYPASEISPYEQVVSSSDIIAGQMEVMEHFLSGQGTKPCVVVLTVKALTQRVLPPEVLQENSLSIKINDKLNSLELARLLSELGYTRSHTVSMRGEFSIRGDIIDIYPSAGAPLRIELFDEEVESLRIFSPDTQRSQEEISAAVIPPRWWVVLKNSKELVAKLETIVEAAALKLDVEAAETLKTVLQNDLPALESGQYPESAEYLSLYADDRFATIFNYLPQNALLALDEWDTCFRALEVYEEKLNDGLNEGLASGRLIPLPRPLHWQLSELMPQLKQRQRLFMSHMPALDVPAESADLVQFDCHGVERFNSQLNQFVDKAKEWRRNNYTVVVSTEQPQRLLGILKEWDCPATYLVNASDAENITSDAQPSSDAAANPVIVTRLGFTAGFRLDDVGLVSITDQELFGQRRKPTVYRRSVDERPQERVASVADLKIGDYVVHSKQGIGQFVGIERVKVDKQEREYLTIQYMGDDKLYVPVDQINLLSRYRGAGDTTPRLSRLGGAEWESTKRRVKRSIRQVAEDLVNLYAMRAKQEGFACLPDTPWQYEMEEAFPYQETPDQWQAIQDSKRDMESTKPMDRLICGDVGFGKTEVAVRAIFKAVMSGRQAAILVPTTILAQQHFNTLSDRFAPYPVRVGLLSRFRTAKEQKEVTQRLATGECDVVIGTHRLLQKDIAFKDLGLVVIDEEQRFGVAHKEKLKQLRVMVDVITMSATPIPRTLYMALSGARDMSLINTPPVNRAPIKTYVGEYKSALVRTAILHEMERGGQIYFVHNRVESIERVAMELKELVPEARIAIGHGQMQERELETVMLDFLTHQVDILVCTTIIESGLDIPNCNTIVIDNADKLGLAQMYQLRGRVGRSNLQAYAYCLFRADKALSETAENRLKAIRDFTSLGSGYQIALRDMEIRGVGNVLGAEQHGHMMAIGFDLYCKLLEESVAELKGEVVQAEADTQIDINITAFIPETYMADGEQKIIEYKRLADVRSQSELVRLTDEWRDRFGPMPVEVQQLVSVVRLRLLASAAGVSAIKPDMMSGIRMSVELRLQAWLPIQNRLPKHLAARTTYKPGSPGGHGSMPYILVRCQELNPVEQLQLLEELLNAMVQGMHKKTS